MTSWLNYFFPTLSVEQQILMHKCDKVGKKIYTFKLSQIQGLNQVWLATKQISIQLIYQRQKTTLIFVLYFAYLPHEKKKLL